MGQVSVGPDQDPNSTGPPAKCCPRSMSRFLAAENVSSSRADVRVVYLLGADQRGRNKVEPETNLL